MDDRARVAWCAVLGAVAGGLWGYFYLTEGGRQMRDQIEPRLDDFITEVRRLRGTVEKARAAANEGWQSLADALGDDTRGGNWQQGRASH